MSLHYEEFPLCCAFAIIGNFPETARDLKDWDFEVGWDYTDNKPVEYRGVMALEAELAEHLNNGCHLLATLTAAQRKIGIGSLLEKFGFFELTTDRNTGTRNMVTLYIRRYRAKRRRK